MQHLDLFFSLLTLIVLEIILGIDNLVFLSILTGKLPKQQALRARRWGLTFAWILRLIMLALAIEIVKLTKPLFSFADFSFSLRDLFLFAGGAFLIAKATQEIHSEVGNEVATKQDLPKAASGFKQVVIQLVFMDLVFSLDSILTAIGLTTNFYVMAIAITCAILVMVYASEPLSRFIKKYPTIKMLALSFLILIGMVLVADSFAFHVPRAYVYFAMCFSLGVEALNLIRQARRK